MTPEQLISLANLAACLVVAYICMCRLNMLSTRSTLRSRLKYTVLLTGALTLAGLPILFSVSHNTMTLGGAGLVLILLALEVGIWRHGPPQHTLK